MANSSRSAGKREPVEDPVVVAEIERKFDIPAGFELPDLSGLPGVAKVEPGIRQELDATYFDSHDLRLISNKVTLRRRTGGDDAGWHLKRPRLDGDRDELRAPLGRATRTVPAALRTPVAVHARDADLMPVARLATDRTVHRFLDSSEAVLAEIALDTVTASRPSDNGRMTTIDTWSELEVELIGGDHALLDALVGRVTAAGATASDSPSKLSRALGDRLPAPRPALPEGVEKGSAGEVLLDHLRDHVTRLKGQDPLVRADQHDAVHQMRVATRRLRSALATFRPMLDREVTDPLRTELQWLGSALGGARDAEVIRDHLQELVQSQPEEYVLGPVLERIGRSMGARYRAAHDEALVDLDTERYFRLLDALDRLIDSPPFTDLARGNPDDVLLPLVSRAYRRMRKLIESAHAESEPQHHDELLHEVRKAAKRARYAGEAVTPTYGKAARDWASRMAAIQEALGEHQDSVVIRVELIALAEQAHQAGENAFTYGRLHGLEEARAADSEDRFERAWATARDKSAHSWLSP